MSKVLLHELGKSLSYGRLSLLAKVLWPMLLATSDDQGRGTAEADAIKWYVCPNVPEIVVDQISALLDEMCQQGMIALYNCDRGTLTYQVIRWWEYQSLRWARPSRFSAPDDWTDRIRYSNRGDIHQKDWDEAGGFSKEERADVPTEDYKEDCPEDGTDIQPNSTQPNSTQPNPTQSHDPTGAGAPDPPLPKKHKRPRAVDTFRENAHRFPAKAWYATIGDVVGDEPTDLEEWGRTVFAWVGLGWNPTNVKGMLECYERNEMPGQNRATGPPGGDGHKTNVQLLQELMEEASDGDP